MTTLTQIAVVTRKIVRYGIFLIIFLIVGKITLDLGVRTFRYFFPKPPPPPTVSFGKLPKVLFPEREQKSISSIKVETTTGELPKLPTQAKVYFMPKLSPHLLSLDAARQKAASLGFPDQQQVSQTVYQFKNPNFPSTLEMNIVTGAFSISSDLSADSSVANLRPPAPEVAASQIRAFLSAADLLPAEQTGPSTHEFLKIEDKNLKSAISLSEANFVRVNLFRKSYDNLPSLTPYPNEANIWFTVSGLKERGKQIVAGQYHYFPVDGDQSSTYPTKTAQQALDELKLNAGYIANFGENPDGNITVRRIYLAYYDPNVPMEFFQPIFAFEGDNGFMAYIPAVTSEYYGE